MKKLSWLALLGLLVGCNDGGSPSGAYGSPTDMRPDRKIRLLTRQKILIPI